MPGRGAVEGVTMPGGEKSVRLTENFCSKKMSDALEPKQKDLWRRAADRVTPWGKVQMDDYDFRSWMKKGKDAPKQLLEAGCIYEYVRESRKLRCLLVLMDPKRKREPFEITLSVTGKERHLPCSFEGLGEEDACRTLGGALYWLRRYTKELAENMSFAELLRVKGDEVKRSLSKRPLHWGLWCLSTSATYLSHRRGHGNRGLGCSLSGKGLPS